MECMYCHQPTANGRREHETCVLRSMEQALADVPSVREGPSNRQIGLLMLAGVAIVAVWAAGQWLL